MTQDLEMRLRSLRDKILKWPDGNQESSVDDYCDEIDYKLVEVELETVIREIAAATPDEQAYLRTMLDDFHAEIKVRCDNTRKQLSEMTQKIDHNAQYIRAAKAYSQS